MTMNLGWLPSIASNRRAFRFFLAATVLSIAAFSLSAVAQDQYEDPPGRVARLGYMQGSVSFEPAGESEWVQAVPNRPMTIGDRLWADQNSRAEVELGSASIHLAPNTGFSFLNLDDRTVQIELTSGTLDIRVRDLNQNNIFEVDTPNQAFSAFAAGHYRIEASEDGNSTVVTVRDGDGESTGNGQAYTIRAGQRILLSGTNSLNAEVEQIGNPDEFDNWSYSRERRYENARSAQYCSRDLVGMEDLDDYGDWRSSPDYGDVWYPRVNAGWAPYREGNWAWIDPWGWTWVDEDPWGYAPFHYGRWASIDGRWGWIPGPRQERPVYAPALVVFVGGGLAAGNVGWFPLGPREVYVPSYRVSQAYVNRVNVTNTRVNTTTITNVYNTTIVNKNTTITNVNYVNRSVQGAVTAVPQRAFASAQPVARNAVNVNSREIASAPVSARATVPPAQAAVLGAHASTGNRVATPPRAVAERTVIAKATPPPPPASFSARQQALQAHPGQPIDRAEMQKLHPAANAAPAVKQAPPAKPATPTQANNQPPNRPAPANERPGAATPPPARPGNQPAPSNRPEAAPNNRPTETNRPAGNPPAPAPSRNDRPPSAEPGNRPNPPAPNPNNRPEPNRPEPNNRPEANRPTPNTAPAPQPRNDRPSAAPENRPQPAPTPNNRPEPNRAEPNNRPEANRPTPNAAPAPQPRNDRPPSAEPGNRPNPPAPTPNNRPEPNRPEPNNRPDSNRPTPNAAPAPPPRNDRPSAAPENPPQPVPNNRPEARPSEPPRNQPAPRPQTPPPASRPEPAKPSSQARPPEPQQSKPQNPNEKKQQEQQRKKDENQPQHN